MNRPLITAALLSTVIGCFPKEQVKPPAKPMDAFLEDAGFTALRVQQSIEVFDVGYIFQDQAKQQLYGSLEYNCNAKFDPDVIGKGSGPDSVTYNSTYELTFGGAVGFDGSSLSPYVPNLKIEGDYSKVKTVVISFRTIQLRRIQFGAVDKMIESCPKLAQQLQKDSALIVSAVLIGNLNLKFADKNNRGVNMKIGWKLAGIEGGVKFKEEQDGSVTSEKALVIGYQGISRSLVAK